MKKIKNKFIAAKEATKDYLNGLSVDWCEFTWDHPGIAGFIEGALIVYWSLVLSAWFMKIFKHKKLGWVDITK